MRLHADLAARFARIALGHVTREYPQKLDHVMLGDEDASPPRELHPIFYGSFDWHSCVHGWWTLLTVRRMFPENDEADAIGELADASFTPAKIAVELSYLDRPMSAGFERPYGWGWLLYRHLEASRHGPMGSTMSASRVSTGGSRFFSPRSPSIRSAPTSTPLCVNSRSMGGGMMTAGRAIGMAMNGRAIALARHGAGGDGSCRRAD